MKTILPILVSVILIDAINASTLERTSQDTTQVHNENVIYKVSGDELNLYLEIETADKSTIMSIIRHGFTIYFDVRGKQKKDVYVKYPYENNPALIREKPVDAQDNGEPARINLSAIVENMSDEAEYGHFDYKQQFHKQLNNLDISLEYRSVGDLFEFSLKIPKNRITTRENQALANLTIGVITNKPERTGDKEKNRGQDPSRMRSGRGKRTGMERGGMSRGQSGQGSRQRPNIPEITIIDFWFDANLE